MVGDFDYCPDKLIRTCLEIWTWNTKQSPTTVLFSVFFKLSSNEKTRQVWVHAVIRFVSENIFKTAEINLLIDKTSWALGMKNEAQF